MELTLSTHLLVYEELQDGTLDLLRESGFPGLEVWLAEPHVPWRSPAALEAFRRRLTDRGLRAPTVHLPFYPSVPELREAGQKWSVIDADAARRRTAVDGAAEGLRAAAALGARAGVLHLGWQRDEWGAAESERAREAVAELLAEARACGVQLLLENIISAGTLSRRLVELLRDVDPDGEAGVCLDLGHAHVEGDVLAQLEDALPRLRHLHVHDNEGNEDSHLAPGQGSIPWAAVLERLRELEYEGCAALELRDFSRGQAHPEQVLASEIPKVRRFQDEWAERGLLPAAPARA